MGNFFLIHRCMLRVVVEDGDSTATFEMCDYLLKDIQSLDYNELVSCLVYLDFFVVLSCALNVYGNIL